VGYVEFAIDERIQLQAEKKQPKATNFLEDHHFASCDESPFTVSLLNDLKSLPL